jgi:cyclopropane fatty-acyl-phospholipid synthase-like methyltransferase
VDYDSAYSTEAALFGDAPERILEAYSGRLPRERPVLDVGAGQGRNTLTLARGGVTVDAIDPSAVAVETVSTKARAEALSVRTHQVTLESFVPPELPFGGVLLFGVLQILTHEAIARLVDTVTAWTDKGSLVFVTAFTTADPAHKQIAEVWQHLGRHSYRDPSGHEEIRTYFEPDEILELFGGWQSLHLWQGLGPEHHHGDGVVERHGSVEAVLVR